MKPNKNHPKDDRYYGLKPETYALMLSAVWREYRRCRKSKGRNYRFGPERMLKLFLCRTRYNDTFCRLARDFGTSKSTAHRLYWRMMEVVRCVKEFRLLSPSQLEKGVYTMDASIIRTLRRSDWVAQKRFYSGKHHAHCAKMQIIAAKGSKCPLCVTFTRYGSTHDYGLFKRMAGKVPEGVVFDADSGYQGLEDLIPGSLTPYKKPKNGSLTQEQKDFNKALSSTRVKIEHCNSYIKRFAVIGTVYRGAVNRLEYVVKLICGICKFELSDCMTFYAVWICGTTLLKA